MPPPFVTILSSVASLSSACKRSERTGKFLPSPPLVPFSRGRTKGKEEAGGFEVGEREGGG